MVNIIVSIYLQIVNIVDDDVRKVFGKIPICLSDIRQSSDTVLLH